MADVESRLDNIDGAIENLNETLGGLRSDVQMGFCIVAAAVSYGGGLDDEYDVAWIQSVVRRASKLYEALPEETEDESGD